MRAAVLVTVMAAVTMLLRFLPFLVFRKEPPAYITYLGKVLPPAIIGMLVIYCLKDVSLFARPFGLPELIAVAGVAAVQADPARLAQAKDMRQDEPQEVEQIHRRR